MTRWSASRHVLVPAVVLTLVALVSAAAGAQERTITYMIWSTDPQDQESMLGRARAFEAENPGVKVDVLFSTSTGDQRTKILTMHAAGVTPDLFVVSRPWQYELWAMGLFLPLNEFIERNPDLNFPDIINAEQVTMGGQIIGIHHHGGGQQLAFNAALFDAAGLARPDALYRAGAWTHEAFVESVRAITRDLNGDGQPDIFGTGAMSSGHNFLSFLRTFGTTLLDPESGQPRINTPEGIAAIRYVSDLAVVYNAVGGNNAAGTQGIWNQCPRCVFRDWGREDVFPFEWNIVPYPKGEHGHRNVGGHNFFAVASNSRHPELAFAFIMYELRPDVIEASLANGAIITPVRASTFRSPLMAERFPGLNMDVFLKAASTDDYLVPETVKVPGLDESIAVANREIQAVMAGSISPETAALNIHNEIVQAILPRYR